MNEADMIKECVEKIRSMNDDALQALWDRLCAGFFLADGAKKRDLEKFTLEQQRAFLPPYAEELLKSHSFVEPFWRYVVKEEQFSF